MKSNASTATQAAPRESNWIQQLWQRIAAPISDASGDKQAESAPQRGLEASTRSPELAPPVATIGSQTLKAFSDYAEEYEPAHIALVDLIPAELSLLDISPRQAQVPAETDSSLIETANAISTYEEFDCDNDEEYLSVLIPTEDLAELSEDVEKTLPDLSAF